MILGRISGSFELAAATWQLAAARRQVVGVSWQLAGRRQVSGGIRQVVAGSMQLPVTNRAWGWELGSHYLCCSKARKMARPPSQSCMLAGRGEKVT